MSPRARGYLALAAVVLLALAVRLLGLGWVFVDDGVVFAPSDAMYHMRRALFGFTNYPDILMWDSYINYPDGAPIPWPPLFDVLLASAGALFASNEAEFERVAALVPPVLGALTVVPVFGIARRLRSIGTGLAAGTLYALIPIGVNYSRVGNTDHHCAVALLGACLLYLTVRLVELPPDAAARRRIALGLALARAALLLTWHGSLLYLALLEPSLLLAAALTGRRDLAATILTSAIATLALVVPVIAASPPPLGGPWSAIALSQLHVSVVAGVALCSAVLLALAHARPTLGPTQRLGTVVAIGVALLAAAFLLPGPREGLAPALDFLTLEDAMGSNTGEQFALFSFAGRRSEPDPLRSWGAFAYALPVLPLALGLLVRRRAGVAVLAGWTTVLVALAIHQVRYGNDAAPAAAAALALVGSELAEAAARRFGIRSAVTTALALGVAGLALLPPIVSLYVTRASGSLATLTGTHPVQDRRGATVAGTLSRFLERVRANTPETRSFLSPDGRPEYGIVSTPNLGHAIQYVARRPTPTDPFWSYIGQQNWDRAFALLDARSERDALEAARALRARFLITTSRAAGDTLEAHLHQLDGLPAVQRPRLARFRLVAEAPRGAPSLRSVFEPGRTDPDVPYKLWEIVQGALLEVPAEPGTRVGVWLDLVTETGREFVYQARAAGRENGVARIRVPYATVDGKTPVRSHGSYRIRSGALSGTADVSEAAVLRGHRIPVTLTRDDESPG